MPVSKDAPVQTAVSAAGLPVVEHVITVVDSGAVENQTRAAALFARPGIFAIAYHAAVSEFADPRFTQVPETLIFHRDGELTALPARLVLDPESYDVDPDLATLASAALLEIHFDRKRLLLTLVKGCGAEEDRDVPVTLFVTGTGVIALKNDVERADAGYPQLLPDRIDAALRRKDDGAAFARFLAEWKLRPEIGAIFLPKAETAHATIAQRRALERDYAAFRSFNAKRLARFASRLDLRLPS